MTTEVSSEEPTTAPPFIYCFSAKILIIIDRDTSSVVGEAKHHLVMNYILAGIVAVALFSLILIRFMKRKGCESSEATKQNESGYSTRAERLVEHRERRHFERSLDCGDIHRSLD